MYSCHLLLISSASVGSILFLSYTEPIFSWNTPLVSLIFLKRCLVFPFYCFPLFLCTDPKGRLSYISLLFFGTLHSDGSIFAFFLFFSLLFTAFYKASSDSHFAFLHFFSLQMFLISASCTVSWASVLSSSGTLSGSIPWMHFSLLLYNRKGLDLVHTGMVWCSSLLSSI